MRGRSPEQVLCGGDSGPDSSTPSPLLSLLRQAMGSGASAVRKDATVCLVNLRRTFGDAAFDEVAGRLLSKRQLDLVRLFGEMQSGRTETEEPGGGGGGAGGRLSHASHAPSGGRTAMGASRRTSNATTGFGRGSSRFRGLPREPGEGKLR